MQNILLSKRDTGGFLSLDFKEKIMGRVVVITGGTSGIGEACAKEFEKNGDTVIVMSRKNNNHSLNS